MYYYASKLTAASLNGSSIGNVDADESEAGNPVCRCHEVQDLTKPQSPRQLQQPSHQHPRHQHQPPSPPRTNTPTYNSINSEHVFATCVENPRHFHSHRKKHEVRFSF